MDRPEFRAYFSPWGRTAPRPGAPERWHVHASQVRPGHEGQGDPARAQARRRLPVWSTQRSRRSPVAADEPGDAAQVEPGIVEGRPVGVRHDGGAARCCGEDVRDAWCASGRTSRPPSRPSISSSPVRSPAGVTGKSSLATADAPGNTDRPRWLGVKCVIAERQLRSRPDNRQIAGGVA